MEPTQSHNFENNLEAEIAQLSKEIETKRKMLAEQKGIVEEGADKELVRDVLRERIFAGSTSAQTDDGNDDDKADDIKKSTSTVSRPTGKPAHDYLENLDSATIIRVNELVAELGKGGLEAAIRQAKKEPANVLDAFHDTLVNRLYDDLKQRGLVK